MALGPFTITVLANRTVKMGGLPYIKGQTAIFKDVEVPPEVPLLIAAGYVSSSPAMPTGAAFSAMVKSLIKSDSDFQYLSHTTADAIDQDIADGATYDYVHNLKSLHVGVCGRYERISGGSSVELTLAPFGKTSTMDVKTLVIDDNTIRIKNDTGGGAHIRARLQAYILG